MDNLENYFSQLLSIEKHRDAETLLLNAWRNQIGDSTPAPTPAPTIQLSLNAISTQRGGNLRGLDNFIDVNFRVTGVDDTNVRTVLSADFNSNALTVTLREINGDDRGVIRVRRTDQTGQGAPAGAIRVEVRNPTTGQTASQTITINA